MIEVNHLTKKFGSHTAVSDISFTIEKGCVCGFLGPNGAGKSTTMNIMTGCLAATSGEVKIGGFDIFSQAGQAKKLIGYLPEIPPLYTDRTPVEYLTFVAGAKGISKADIPAAVSCAIEKTNIQDVRNRLIKHLSKGYRQRVGFAQALIGNPEIIILDEPTVGLDPKQIIEIRELITELGKNHTVILSTHILSEVQAVCNKVIIISGGRLVACDDASKLEKHFVEKTRIIIRTEATVSEAQKILSSIENVVCTEISEKDGGAVCHIETDTKNAAYVQKNIFFAFSNENKAILETTTEKASLEEIFIELTADNKTEKEADAQ